MDMQDNPIHTRKNSVGSITFPSKQIEKSSKKHPGFAKNLSSYVREYTQNTALHGVRYLGEKKRNIFETLWWLVVFFLSLCACVNLILRTYSKWNNSPVIVSFAQSPTPVWQIPFPAVTVCPETKARISSFNFTEMYYKYIRDNITEQEMALLEKVSLVCEKHLFDGSDNAPADALKYLYDIALHREDFIYSCAWTNQNGSCAELFTVQLTEEGICYTFNMLDYDDIFTEEVMRPESFLRNIPVDRYGWTLEHGYTKESGKDTFPRRAMSAGESAGLSMILRAYTYDLDYICKGPVQGFKILLHQPGEVPRMATQYFRAGLNQEVTVNVKPDMMTTSDSLRNYDSHRRKCYFSTERSLRFYKNYTQQNCEMECLTNFTLASCGCVSYAMPHNRTTPVCGSGKHECMALARHELLAQQVTSGLFTDNDISSCDCLPACTSLSYSIEISQVDFYWLALFKAFQEDPGSYKDWQLTRFTIFFKDMQFITSIRNELYGLTDFLANCGGLLGLFIGFSFLSLVETVYFLTLRLWCNLRRHGKHYWSGSDKLIKDDKYDYNK